MLFLMLTGVAQFIYCVLITNYPFNAFLGGSVVSLPGPCPLTIFLTELPDTLLADRFAATVGQFVLCGALRIQSNPLNKATFPTISPERSVTTTLHRLHHPLPRLT